MKGLHHDLPLYRRVLPLRVRRVDGDAMKTRESRIAFFLAHAGTSYNPATETHEQGALRGANHYADVEEWRAAINDDEGREIRIEWDADQDDPEDCLCDGEDIDAIRSGRFEWLVCSVKYTDATGKVYRASCGGIMVTSLQDPYIRVMEAELCSEVWHEAMADELDSFDSGDAGAVPASL